MKLHINARGQIGVDISALKAAKQLNIPTGGFIPQGFKTLRGQRCEYKTLYNLVETESPNYNVRTFLNVENSDATLRVATNFNTPGEVCTLNAIKKFNKPYIDVPAGDCLHERAELTVNKLLEIYTSLNKPEGFVINCAGNANIRLERWAERFFTIIFKELLVYDSR